MATFKLTALELSGLTGLTLTLRDGTGSTSEDSGDALTETGSTGYFTASPTADDGSYFYFVLQSGVPIYRGEVTFVSGVGVADASGGFSVEDRATLAAIKAKTDLIGTGVALVVAPVTPQGKIRQIFIGDDYLAANGRAFEWTIDEPTGFTAVTSTCSFGGSNGTDRWLVSGTITDLGSTWRLSFDLLKTDTENLDAGIYEWTVEVKNAAGTEHTIAAGGDTRLRLKYT